MKGASHLVGIYRAPDGKGWFTASQSAAGTALLHVDLQGTAHPVWETGNYGGAPVARPRAPLACGGEFRSKTYFRVPTVVRSFTYNRFQEQTIPIFCDISWRKVAGFRRNLILMRLAFKSGVVLAGVALCLAAFLTLSARRGFAQTDDPEKARKEAAKPASSEIPIMAPDPTPALLENGFHSMYGLDFQGARQEILAYQKARPEDPMGKAAEAASYLFEEFNSKGVLSSEFFLNDDKLLKGLEGKPEENANLPFVAANGAARHMAKEQLKSNPQDTNAMLVLAMVDGMESDYDQVIEKKQIPAVSLTKQAENEASTLLARDPNAIDAYVALGAGHYIIGCLPGYKRAFLWFGGIHGDRERGMEEMKKAASDGHYLRPFAKILLALAYRREHQPDQARVLLSELTEQFPTNPRFAYELSLVQPHNGTAEKPQCCR